MQQSRLLSFIFAVDIIPFCNLIAEFKENLLHSFEIKKFDEVHIYLIFSDHGKFSNKWTPK